MEDSKEWGKKAENIAAEFLISNGYVVRERNWRVGKTIELDIIAQSEDTIIFVEVKARNGKWEDPVEAVDDKKIRKMVRGADIYLKKESRPFAYRFDIIAITGTEDNYTLDHYPDAFLPPLSIF